MSLGQGKIVYLLEFLLSLRTDGAIEFDGLFFNDLRHLRQKEQLQRKEDESRNLSRSNTPQDFKRRGTFTPHLPYPLPHPSSFYPSPHPLPFPVSPYSANGKFLPVYGFPPTFNPQKIHPKEYQSKNFTTNFKYPYLKSDFITRDEAGFIRCEQLPPNCKIIKAEPGMVVPPGAVRVPASLFRSQMGPLAPMIRTGYMKSAPISPIPSQPLKPFNENSGAVGGPGAPRVIDTAQLKSDSLNSSINESMENKASGVKDDSPTSTWGSSYDSYNIQIQLPK